MCQLVSFFFFSSRRRHTRWPRDWSSDVCSSDLLGVNHFMMAQFAHQDEWTQEQWDRAVKRNKKLRLEDYEWLAANCTVCSEVGADSDNNVNLKYGEHEL